MATSVGNPVGYVGEWRLQWEPWTTTVEFRVNWESSSWKAQKCTGVFLYWFNWCVQWNHLMSLVELCDPPRSEHSKQCITQIYRRWLWSSLIEVSYWMFTKPWGHFRSSPGSPDGCHGQCYHGQWVTSRQLALNISWFMAIRHHWSPWTTSHATEKHDRKGLSIINQHDGDWLWSCSAPWFTLC